MVLYRKNGRVSEKRKNVDSRSIIYCDLQTLQPGVSFNGLERSIVQCYHIHSAKSVFIHKEITCIALTGFQKGANPFFRKLSGHAIWKGASKSQYSYSFYFLKKKKKAILKMACKLKLPLASFKLCDSHLCKMLLEEFLGSH